MFSGSLIPIITPFKDGAVDEKRFVQLIEFHIAGGTDGIVPAAPPANQPPCPTRSTKRIIDICVEAVNHRVRSLPGRDQTTPARPSSLTRCAKTAGADGALLITPYYNRPTQEGLYQHYRAIASRWTYRSFSIMCRAEPA